MVMTIANKTDKKIIEELIKQSEELITRITTDMEKLEYDYKKKLILKGFLEDRKYSIISMETFELDYNDENEYINYSTFYNDMETKLSDLNQLKSNLQTSLDIYNKNYN